MRLHETESEKNESNLDKIWKETTEIVIYECRDPEKMSQRSQNYFHGMINGNQSTVGLQLCLQYKYGHMLLACHRYMGNVPG